MTRNLPPITAPNPKRDEILALFDKGLSQTEIAGRVGVNKNVVAGLWHRAGRSMPMVAAKTTMSDRLDALHAKLDAVLAETQGIGRILNEPRGK